MKFLLDSGDPQEYKEISELAKANKSELWGATTNPSLIAKKLLGKKLTQKELYDQQKQIVLEIVKLVPGAVSAEVYADKNTSPDEMIQQGLEIASWHERVVVKLPTTIEGFKARTELRKQGISINNTLVFSQQQIFAICLHEKLIQASDDKPARGFPPFISPFVGRLDDKGQNGMELIELGVDIKNGFDFEIWMLESSVRSVEHVKLGFESTAEIITAPAKVYKEWFALSEEEKWSLESFSYAKDLKSIEPWKPSDKLAQTSTMEQFYEAIESGELDIFHELTQTGLERFAADWNALII